VHPSATWPGVTLTAQPAAVSRCSESGARVDLPLGPRHHHAAIISCCSSTCCVRQSTARLRAGEPAEPDREARLEGFHYRPLAALSPGLTGHHREWSGRCDSLFLRACTCRLRVPDFSQPGQPSLTPSLTHYSLFTRTTPPYLLTSPSSLKQRPSHCVQDRTRPVPNPRLPNSKRNAHPFPQYSCPACLHALHREIARPATGTPTRVPSVGLAVPHLIFSRGLPCRTAPGAAPAAAPAAAAALLLPLAALLPCHLTW
jgi:hypothetical protein